MLRLLRRPFHKEPGWGRYLLAWLFVRCLEFPKRNLPNFMLNKFWKGTDAYRYGMEVLNGTTEEDSIGPTVIVPPEVQQQMDKELDAQERSIYELHPKDFKNGDWISDRAELNHSSPPSFGKDDVTCVARVIGSLGKERLDALVKELNEFCGGRQALTLVVIGVMPYPGAMVYHCQVTARCTAYLDMFAERYLLTRGNYGGLKRLGQQLEADVPFTPRRGDLNNHDLWVAKRRVAVIQELADLLARRIQDAS